MMNITLNTFICQFIHVIALVIFSQAIIVMLLYYIHVEKILMEVSKDGSKTCQIDH